MDVTRYNKFIVAIVAAVAVAGSGIADGTFDGNDLVQSILAFLGAIGVYAAKNTPASK